MKFFDRVKTTTTTTGTGNITCSASAVSADLRTLPGAGAVVGDVFPYAIGIAGSAEWECGVGTITAISSGFATFSRTPTASSNNNQLVNFSTGSKEVVCTPLGATLTKWENGTSARVVFTSSFCVSDGTTLSMTPTTGASQQVALQKMLDINLDGKGLIAICDGAYTVAAADGATFAMLKMSSNTTIRALPGCGLICAANSSMPLLGNRNPTIDPSQIVDKNLTIDGGIWHGNRDNQTTKFSLMDFTGVDGLNMIGKHELRKGKAFAWHAVNVYHVTIRDGRVDFGDGNTEVNTDGYHFNGPFNYVDVGSIELFNCADDGLAFNVDDAWGAATFTGPFDNVYGPGLNISVKGVKLRGTNCGIRLLSGGSPMDRIYIGDVSGTTGAYWLVIDNFNGTQDVLHGPGNINRLIIEDIQMDNTPLDGWTSAQAHFNCKIRQLTIRNVLKNKYNDVLFPAILFGPRANIGQCLIDGFMGSPDNGGSYLTEQIQLASGARCGLLKIINSDFYAPNAVSGCPIAIEAGATVDRLVLSGLSGLNFTDFLRNNGAVGQLHNSVAGTAMDVGAVSTWSFDGSYTEQSETAVTYNGPNASKFASAVKKVNDTFGANIRLPSVRVRFVRTGTGGSYVSAMGLILRGVNAQPWGDSATAYFMKAQAGSAGGSFGLWLKAGSNETAIATINTAVDVNSIYEMTPTVKGNVLSGMVRRVSDGLYLQTDGTWSSTVTTALSGTSNALGAGGGLQYGTWSYANDSTGAACSVEVSQFTAIAAP